MSPGRKRLVAIGVGVCLAALPAVAFHVWLDGLVERQAKEDIDRPLRRSMTLAERRLGAVAETLDVMAARGVASCLPSSLEAMRQAVLTTTPIKEIAVLDAGGGTLCTQLGLLFETRTVASSEPLTADGRLLIETMRVGAAQTPMLRLRRRAPDGAHLAALMPSDLMIAPASARGGPLNATARLMTGKGTMLAQSFGSGFASEASEPLRIMSHASSIYALSAVTAMPEAVFEHGRALLRQIAVGATAATATLLLALALAMRLLGGSRTRRDNPIEEMERALARGEFVPFYQPIVDIRSGRLRGAEVLLRWRKPDGSLVSPATFVPLAESSGLIVELTRALMRRVRDEAGPAFSERPTVRLGFNLTAQQFTSEQIIDDVREIFGPSPIKLSQLILELTERHPIDNLTETRRVIAALQGLGVQVAIDDVGTGHSGLSYILKLGVDVIKIDKVFIDSIGVDRHSTTIVETLVDLARNMRMEVVAEGVENFEQVIHLRSLGIRAAQGFVFAPPLPGSAFLQLLEAIEGPRQVDLPRSHGSAPSRVPPLRNLQTA